MICSASSSFSNRSVKVPNSWPSDAFLARVAPGRSRAAVDQRDGWADVLVLAPKGFKSDTPNLTDYRRRLTALAHSVAADIDAIAG